MSSENETEDTVRKIVRAMCFIGIVVGTTLFLTNFLRILPLPDLVVMYSMGAVSVSLFTLLTTTKYTQLGEDFANRLAVQKQQLMARAQRDEKRENKKQERYAEKH